MFELDLYKKSFIMKNLIIEGNFYI